IRAGESPRLLIFPGRRLTWRQGAFVFGHAAARFPLRDWRKLRLGRHGDRLAAPRALHLLARERVPSLDLLAATGAREWDHGRSPSQLSKQTLPLSQEPMRNQGKRNVNGAACRELSLLA